MEIARERFLDDSRTYHLTLALRSRTTEMHSALTALSTDDRDRIAVALARALDEIQEICSGTIADRRSAVGATEPMADR
jgi:hypothetical protein